MFSKLVNFRNLKQLTNKSKKFFDLHEYQSKDIMRSFNIRVQNGAIATTPEEAEKVSQGLSNKGGLILKAQVHAGGRGKGTLSSGMKGGVQILNTPQEVAEKTRQMIGYNLVTHQTRKDGLPVKAVLIHEGVDIVRQIYLAFILDRKSQRPCLVVSTEGGVEIEAVAAKTPELIHSYPFDPSDKVPQNILDDVVNKLGLQSQASDAKEQIQNLYTMFNGIDATQVEINPWATDPSETLYCVDAKLNIDDNASFRQKQLIDLRRNSLGSEDVDVHEEQAQKAGLSYVGLDGNIGCLVNGAGLAMATMDVIKLHGAEPANFLDVGGGASVDQVKTAFEILTSHPSVKVIFINIFGGILSCQTIADGIAKAAQLVSLDVPLVVRLYGNAYIEGKETLMKFATEKGFNIQVAADMDEGAKLAAAIVNKK